MIQASALFLVGLVVVMGIWIGALLVVAVRAARRMPITHGFMRLVALGLGVTGLFSSLFIVSVAFDRGLPIPVIAVVLLPTLAIGLGGLSAALGRWPNR